MTILPQPLHQPALIVLDNPADAALAAAQHIAARLTSTPSIVLGLATGATPREVYRHLVMLHGRGALSFSEAIAFNLDEYVGIDATHPASFASYMQQMLFAHVDMAPARAHIPDGTASNLKAAANDYEEAILLSGGIDLQLLGIGRNGHIGFNEPGATHDSRTREVELTPSTIAANTPDFPVGQTPPATALTMGIGTILEAREILLLATGAQKADALAAAIDGPVDLDNPASALRLHPAVTVICDHAAAAKIKASHPVWG